MLLKQNNSKMKLLKINHEKDNLLFKRKEIELDIESAVAPSREEVAKFLSEKYSKPQENIKIKNILGKFGTNTFTVSSNIYDSFEDKEKVELKKKKEIEAEKKKAEKKAAQEEAAKQAAESQEGNENSEEVSESQQENTEESNETQKQSKEENKQEEEK